MSAVSPAPTGAPLEQETGTDVTAARIARPRLPPTPNLIGKLSPPCISFRTPNGGRKPANGHSTLYVRVCDDVLPALSAASTLNVLLPTVAVSRSAPFA